jgi:putative FmdB family regulatory protein
MKNQYQCNKCGTIFNDESSDKFVKTVMKKCPACGSSEVSRIGNVVKSVAKKSRK